VIARWALKGALVVTRFIRLDANIHIWVPHFVQLGAAILGFGGSISYLSIGPGSTHLFTRGVLNV
jgi:hypothetical protein